MIEIILPEEQIIADLKSGKISEKEAEKRLERIVKRMQKFNEESYSPKALPFGTDRIKPIFDVKGKCRGNNNTIAPTLSKKRRKK